jgi:hypothetical protein
LQNIIGFILRIFLVVIIVAAIIFAAYHLRKMKNLHLQKKSGRQRKNIVPKFAEIDNPDMLISSAKKYFAEGQIRKAWAACLSAVLTLYSEQGKILFFVNDTESDCLAKINRSAYWGKEETAQLIMQWIKLAYAGIEPEQECFYKAISFCNELKEKIIEDGDTDE